MCGICGSYDFTGRRPVDQAVLAAMTASIAHRGPDDEGVHVDGELGLGFRRLSIIDLEGGHQPMSDAAGRVWVAFNGEIYNFRELRAELQGHGHVFRTRSDTEVIVHAYLQWGLGFLSRLNGIFGLAVWDPARRRLVLARDRAGVKPLYYSLPGGEVVFGSELRAVLRGLGSRPTLDPVSVNLFLRHGYTPSPFTLWRGVRKLAPGSALVVEDGSARLYQWWQFRPEPLDPAPRPEDAVDELLQRYEAAVERQLVSDVPVGLLLSGGVDSALLLALMNRRHRGWPTYTVGFGEEYASDELADAARSSQLLGGSHAEVRLDRHTFEETLFDIAAVVEEPVASASIVPMYHVCRRARQDVTVALMGQGPDELLGGYKRHVGVRYASAWRALPPWARSLVSGAAAAVPRAEVLRRGAYALAEPDRLRFSQRVLSLLPGDEVDGLFAPGSLPPAAGDAALEAWADLAPLMTGADDLAAFQYLETRSSLPDQLLLYADKLSMWHGLEVRVPYLDHDVIEYALRLPPRLKIRAGVRKWVHKQVARRVLPAEIVQRKKRGFAVDVVDDWFRDSLSGRASDALADPRSLMYSILEPAAVSRLVEAHQAGREDYHKVLFGLVVLEQWLRENEASLGPTA